MESSRKNRYAGTGKTPGIRTKSYKAYKKAYNARPEEKRKRAMRNAARKEAIRKGKVRRGQKNMHVDHKTPLSKGGGNGSGNTQVISARANYKKREREKRG